MRNLVFDSKVILLLFILTGFASVYADDLIFDSFEEAQKAAEQRSAEYDKRMAEHASKVDGAWEKQDEDVGDNSKFDISKITETRNTEQTSENQQNSELQNSVTDSINTMKQQMINTAGANSVGFAGASAGYCWKVKFVNGKYVLSDTYDEAFFVSGKSGSTTTKTASGGNTIDKSADKDKPDNNTSNNEPPATPSENIETPGVDDSQEPTDIADIAEVPNTLGEPSQETDDGESPISPDEETSPASKDINLTTPDRRVTITIQHPTSFKEEEVVISENDSNPNRVLKDFVLPEDTRVKISARANIEVDNTFLTMKIVDDEGEGEAIDSESMKNYRHMFRIPSKDQYFVNIYVNYKDGKDPKKIASLCLPVEAVNFDSRMISR